MNRAPVGEFHGPVRGANLHRPLSVMNFAAIRHAAGQRVQPLARVQILHVVANFGWGLERPAQCQAEVERRLITVLRRDYRAQAGRVEIIERLKEDPPEGAAEVAIQPQGHGGVRAARMRHLHQGLHPFLGAQEAQMILQRVGDVEIPPPEVHRRPALVCTAGREAPNELEDGGVSTENPVPAANFKMIGLFIGGRLRE